MRIASLTLVEWVLALIAFGVMSFLASPAHSAERAEEETLLASARTELALRCGRTARVNVDWLSFETAYVDSFTSETAATYCSEVVRAVAASCATESALVTSVTCHAAAAGTGVKLETRPGGKIDASFDWEGFGLYEQSREWLHAQAHPVETKVEKKTVVKAPAKKLAKKNGT